MTPRPGSLPVWRRSGSWKEVLLRLALATGLAWLVLSGAVLLHWHGHEWQAMSGWTGRPGPVLRPGVGLGQPLDPGQIPLRDGRPEPLGHVSPRFATFGRKAGGGVAFILLRGREAPASEAEVRARTVFSQRLEASSLRDNELCRWKVPGPDPGQGLYLIVRRAGDGSADPLTLWLDTDQGWSGGEAQVLTTGPGGEISAARAGGHLSLAWGYDRPAYPVFVSRLPGGWWTFGGVWLAAILASLLVWPGAGRRLGSWLGALDLSAVQEPARPARGRPWAAWGVAAAGVGLTLLLQLQVRDEVFYSGDAGIKLLLVQQLARGEAAADLRLEAQPWARELWDQGLYPFEPPFVHQYGDRRFAAFPLALPLLSTPFYRLAGFRGLYLVPLLATWALWLGFIRFGRRLFPGQGALSLGLAGLVLASNLSLYSAMFWGHTLAACLAFWGLGLALFPRGEKLEPGRAVLNLGGAGLLLGLAVWFRAETVCLAGAVILTVFLLARPGDRFKPAFTVGLGFLAGLGLVWLALWPLFGSLILTMGHPLGHQAVISQARPDLLAGAEFIGHGLANLVRLQGRLFYYFPLAPAALALVLLGAVRPRLFLSRAQKALFLVYLLYVLTAPFILEPPGKEWGPRYMLPVVPVLSLLAAAGWQRLKDRTGGGVRWAAAGVLVVLLALGAHLNLWVGGKALARDYSARVRPALEMLRTSPERIVACADQHIAQELAAAFKGRTFFHANGPAEEELLVRGLARAGQEGCLFLYYDGDPKPGDLVLEAGGTRLKAGFEDLGRFGRYRAARLKISS